MSRQRNKPPRSVDQSGRSQDHPDGQPRVAAPPPFPAPPDDQGQRNYSEIKMGFDAVCAWPVGSDSLLKRRFFGIPGPGQDDLRVITERNRSDGRVVLAGYVGP